MAHLSWLAGSLVGLPVLGPLVLWLVLRERGPFVRHHTAEALNPFAACLDYSVARDGHLVAYRWDPGMTELAADRFVFA